MKALRLVLFGAVLALFVLFAVNNWVKVPISLPNGSLVSVSLPLVVLVSFLVGWIPVLLLHLAARASWRRRTGKVERLLDEALSTGPRVASPAAVPLAASNASIMPLPPAS